MQTLGVLSRVGGSSGIYLLHHRLICSCSWFEVHLLQCGLFPRATMPSEISAPSWPYPRLHCLPGCTCCVVGPHSLRCSTTTSCRATDASRCTCCSTDLSIATDILRYFFYSMDLPLDPNTFRTTSAGTQTCLGTQTCPWPQTLWGILLTGHSPFESSSQWISSLSSRAAQRAVMSWPSASLGTLPWLLSKCSQAQQSKMISRVAEQQCTKQWKQKKQPLMSTRL